MPIAKFLLYIIYITAIFFLPNGWWVMAGVVIDFTMTIVVCYKNLSLLGKIWRGTIKVLPFVLLTLIFNWWLDSWQAAFWIGLKLIIVCNATMIYAAKMTVTEVAEILADICVPLKVVGISRNDIRILVSVALMMIPTLSKEVRELSQACRAKGISWNLSTLKVILQKTGWSLLGRVNQIEEGLMAKGIEVE